MKKLTLVKAQGETIWESIAAGFAAIACVAMMALLALLIGV